MGEAQERPGVALHRTAHVDEQDDPTRPPLRFPEAQRRRFATGLHPGPGSTPGVHLTAAGGAVPPGPADLAGQAQRSEQAVQLLALGSVHPGHVAVPKLLDAAGRRRGLRRAVVVLALGRLRPVVGDELQLRDREALTAHERARTVAEVGAEHHVVPALLLDRPAQREATGPVHVVTTGRVHDRQRLDGSVHPVRTRTDTGSPQSGGQPDERGGPVVGLRRRERSRAATSSSGARAPPARLSH